MEVEVRSSIQKAARGYYYLAPLWFVLERLAWPGFRSGAIAGGGFLGGAVFYSVEAAIGAAFWHGKPWAGRVALVENIVYLVAIMRFALLMPLNVALLLDSNPDAAQALAGSYQSFLPGALVAGFQIAVQYYGRAYAPPSAKEPPVT